MPRGRRISRRGDHWEPVTSPQSVDGDGGGYGRDHGGMDGRAYGEQYDARPAAAGGDRWSNPWAYMEQQQHLQQPQQWQQDHQLQAQQRSSQHDAPTRQPHWQQPLSLQQQLPPHQQQPQQPHLLHHEQQQQNQLQQQASQQQRHVREALQPQQPPARDQQQSQSSEGSRRSRRDGGSRQRGNRRNRQPMLQEQSLPEDRAHVPLVPDPVVPHEKGIVTAATPFFVKVEVGDFFDREDLALDAPNSEGSFITVWDFDEYDDEDPDDAPPLPTAIAGVDPGGVAGNHVESGEPDESAKDIIMQDIRDILECCSTLQIGDFDRRVRQHLHAMFTAGGRHRVLGGLERVREATQQKLRTSVRIWPAYILALLRKAEIELDRLAQEETEFQQMEAQEKAHDTSVAPMGQQPSQDMRSSLNVGMPLMPIDLGAMQPPPMQPMQLQMQHMPLPRPPPSQPPAHLPQQLPSQLAAQQGPPNNLALAFVGAQLGGPQQPPLWLMMPHPNSAAR